VKFRLVLILFYFSCICRAQSPFAYFEKLKSAKSDTALINVYNALTEYYINNKNDSAAYFNHKSLNLSVERHKEMFNQKGYYYKGVLERLDKKYGDALKSAEKSRLFAKQNNNINDEVAAMNLTGNILKSAGQGRLAVEAFSDALKLSKTHDYKKGMLVSGTSLGLYYKETNVVTSALDYLLNVYPLAEELKDTSALFTSAINLGTLYERTKDKEKAISFYRKALYLNKDREEDENGKAICYFKMGRAFYNLHINDSGEYYLNKTMQIHLKRNDEVGLIYDYVFQAGMYMKKGDYKSAEKEYNTSLQLALKHNDSLRISAVYNSIAEMYKTKNDNQKALENIKNSLKYLPAKTTGEGRLGVYENIARVYKRMGMYKEAYDNFVLYKSWSDSAFNISETKKQTELKLGFEFNQIQEKQKAETEAHELINKAERERDKQQRNFLLAGLALISIFLIIAIRNFRAKQKANIALEKQKKEIEKQKKLVDEKNREISDSINYAHRIQTSCLPEQKEMENYFPQHSLFFKPKDVVSGDFFWAAQNDNNVLIAIGDCTGHGVPGAITSMIGSMLLNEIFYVKKMQMPDVVLTELNRLVKLTLRQEEGSLSKDGMDIAFCMWNKNNNTLYYSGANRSIYLIRSGSEVHEYKATKQSIGGYTSLIQHYDLNTISLQEGDTIVLTTDGYSDQFGGTKEKKFTTKAFRIMLNEMAELNPDDQRKIIEKRFYDWKGGYDQTDDILVFTFKV
jgi:serine phosphatase RsbU (regulator of sigma subunit)